MDFTEAIEKLSDEIDQACYRAIQRGLSGQEIAEELRLIADQMEDMPPTD